MIKKIKKFGEINDQLNWLKKKEWDEIETQ